MEHLIIEKSGEGKGRSFEALRLAHVVANGLWSAGKSDTEDVRPVWAMFAGSDAGLRAFVANLRLGRRAENSDGVRRYKPSRFEFLKTAGHTFAWQRTSAGSVVTAFLPGMFRVDPGMVDPAGISFCMLPPAQWLAEQGIDTEAPLRHVHRLGYTQATPEMVPLAALFAAFLDRRTHCPLVADHRFHLQVLCAFLDTGLASLSTEDRGYYRDQKWGCHPRMGFHEVDTADVGLAPGVACDTTHELAKDLLAREVNTFFEACKEQ